MKCCWLAHFDYEGLVVAATRYYTGRMTADAACFAADLAQAWPELPARARAVIRRELELVFAQDDFQRGAEGRTAGLPLGMDMDREQWELVRAAWLALP